MVDFWLGHSDSSDMDFFYYDPVKSAEWISQLPFGEPTAADIVRMQTQSKKGESL